MEPSASGIYVAFSSDRISWQEPVRVIRGRALPRLDQELLWHPSLIWDENSLGVALLRVQPAMGAVQRR